MAGRSATDRGGQRWGGWRSRELRRAILRRDGDICWLCGQAGSNSLDHLLPSALFPELRWTPANLRPAHLRCNQRRGAHNSSKRYAPDWLDYTTLFGISDNHPAVLQAARAPHRHPRTDTIWAVPRETGPEPAAPGASRPKPTWAIV